MKIFTYGNKDNEKILLLHPMFTSTNFFDFAVEKLSSKYYLIIPTYSGHYENTNYESLEVEEKAINDFLKENNIDILKAIIGFSLGGNMAFHYFCHNQDKVEQVIVDSAPIFKFPRIVKRHFYKKYRKCLHNIKAHPENTVKELNKCFNGMGEAQQYIAPIITLESLKNLIESCYNIDTPKLDAESQGKITFVYGTKDIARLCLPRIKKYKNSKFIKVNSLGHCGYFRENT
ncbi:MAG: alpha/beta hydrolase, partial [Anaeroplasmataceae bacterium]|nr:alpha/beta hydrolase [Anaeroplasmataceae bacterium]